MTVRDNSVDYGQSATQTFDFRERQLLKKVRTCGPGRVLSYDPERFRAVVQPSVNVLMADGSDMERTPIPNVPVLWPGVGKYVLHGELTAGDFVLLVWCQRDITYWKQTGFMSPPPSDRIMSEADVVAVPFPGVLEGGQGTSGVVLESLEDDSRIQIDGDTISLRAMTVNVEGFLTQYSSKYDGMLTPAVTSREGFYGFNSSEGGSISPSTVRSGNVSYTITGLWSQSGKTYATFSPASFKEDWVLHADGHPVGRLNQDVHEWDGTLPEAGNSAKLRIRIQGR